MTQAAKKTGPTAGNNKKTGSKSPTKKSRLIALLSRKKGCGIGVLTKELGWQAHTTRAAITRLRAEGMRVITSRSKAGLTNYQICKSLDGDGCDK